MILVGKPEEKRPLGRPRRRLVDNIKIDLSEDGMVWIALIWLLIGTSGGFL
jgi:transposase